MESQRPIAGRLNWKILPPNIIFSMTGNQCIIVCIRKIPHSKLNFRNSVCIRCQEAVFTSYNGDVPVASESRYGT